MFDKPTIVETFIFKGVLTAIRKYSIIIVTEPTTPLIIMRNPVGLFHLWSFYVSIS